MARINDDYRKLASSYLFSTIGKKVKEYQAAHPEARLIRLGIGDVTKPLPAACIEAFHAAVDEMAGEDTFKGYGPELGYDFLREAVAENDYRGRGADISPDEIFVSDGAKCDTANFQELFARDSTVAVPDPVYPVYVDSNVMAGRTGSSERSRYAGLVYLESTEANGFVPSPPDRPVDLVYLCFPNNPTGAVATKKQLAAWVDYAREHKSIILFDAAYEAYIRDPELPHSIYEIPGAENVAVEFRSFSKTAGFTGARCAFTVVPRALSAADAAGRPVNLHELWARRQTTKFNGVSYPVQRAAAAVYSEQGRAQVRGLIDFYLENARLIRAGLGRLGLACTGGDNSPYIWVNSGRESWEFFDFLLAEARVVITPGSGFGRCGEGFIRITAFNSRRNVEEALERISACLRR